MRSPLTLSPETYSQFDERERLLLIEHDLITPSFEDACTLLGLEVDDIFGNIDWEGSVFRGNGIVDLRDEDGSLKERLVFANLVTQVGDQYYGERASGIGSPPAQVTGMQLGTGTTAVAKTGAGAAIVTYISGSAQALDGSFPTSALSGSSRRIQWKVSYAAGTATATGIAEASLINQSVGTNSGAAAAATISRFLLSPTVNKGASDTLAITWNHDLLGA